MWFSTLIKPPTRAFFPIEHKLPIRAKDRTLRELPRVEKSKALAALPNRAKLRSDTELPKLIASITESRKQLPTAVKPCTEQELPKRTVRRFYLESNLATDKKTSQINVIRTRGKRVIAEATIPRDVLVENMRVEPRSLSYHSRVSTIGAFLSGANNNGAHSPNAITAMFIATGQDVANVSESSAGLVYTELTPERDLYMSITLPSLIVATCGGGTGLPTQQESLRIMQCAGPGKVMKFAEIVAGTVLAGEISLAAAISSLDWVSSHDLYGRNDPGKVM